MFTCGEIGLQHMIRLLSKERRHAQSWHRSGGDQFQEYSTYSLYCSSFLGLPFGILNIELVKPKRELQWRPYGNTGVQEFRVQDVV